MFFRPSLKYFNWYFMHCSTRPPTKCNVTYYGYNYSMWYQMVHLISYHIFERKWNWPTIVLKYFVSEKIIWTKNGGGGTHFARSLNSKFLKGLTHSALITLLTIENNIIKYYFVTFILSATGTAFSILEMFLSQVSWFTL